MLGFVVVLERCRAYLVHAYTASTLFFVVLGTQWLFEGKFKLALIAMVVTILIDATDGMLARRYRVKEMAAAVDGELLDNIVDFLSYVVFPMLFMMRADMLLTPVTLWVSFVLFASAFGFSRTTAKQANEGFFVGFPSYWNIVVYYLYLLGTSATLNTFIIAFLAALVFIPLRFLYISRLTRWRTLHFALASVWGVLGLTALAMPEGLGRTYLLLFSLSYMVFYALHSLQLDLESRRVAKLGRVPVKSLKQESLK